MHPSVRPTHENRRESPSSRWNLATGALVRRLRHWRARRVAIRQLSKLDDRLLRDIGIDRSQLPIVVGGLLRESERPAAAPKPPSVVSAARAAPRIAVNDNRAGAEREVCA